MNKPFFIKQAAILGAGVMGAQIAAHLTNCGIKTLLFDLPSSGKDINEIPRGAIKALAKLKPAPLACQSDADLIEPCNYEQDLEKLADCDFILEAISERKSYKQELYAKIKPFIKEDAVIASNTSGISIEALAQSFEPKQRERFLGVHFFNPPRYMKLVELIPHKSTDKQMLDSLEAFLVVRLGKGVVYAKDTPNFVGNRIGVFAMLCVVHHAQQFGLSPDLVDALTGPLIGRPKSATFRTMDVVGLDTMAHVVQTLKDGLKDDPWQKYFELPEWINELISKGALGQKSRQGIYVKDQGKIKVFDSHHKTYRDSAAKPSAEVVELLKKPIAEQISSLAQSDNPQAQFLWSCFRDLFHYCAYQLPNVAEKTSDIDLALRWGYGWQVGPFELWQLSGASKLTELIHADIEAGKTMAKVVMPDWFENDAKPFYQQGKARSPSQGWQAQSDLACYRRQLFPESLVDSIPPETHIVFENEGLCAWHMDDKDLVVSFKTKKNCISKAVLEGMIEAIDRAERDFDALILWQKNGPDFSVGANLKEIVAAIQKRAFKQIDGMIGLFHQVAMRLKYASVPTIAAISGLSLGGGTEFALHTHRRVAAFETYMGLPEVAIGLIPAGGGSKEMALRAFSHQLASWELKPLETMFGQIAKAEISTSSQDARNRWYLSAFDKQIANRDELLFEAKRMADSLKGLNFVPPMQKPIVVPGKTAIANFMAFLTNMLEGQFISEHDYLVGSKLAHVMCGGAVDAGTQVDEAWVLDLEKAAFMELVESPLTLARIEHTLNTGKPLRN